MGVALLACRPPWRSGSAASPATSTAWASSWPRRPRWSPGARSSAWCRMTARRPRTSMKLYLVRHGQSTGNIGGTLMGQSDHPLTAARRGAGASGRCAARALRPHARATPATCRGRRATAEHIVAVLDARRGRRRTARRRSSSTRACARSTSATTRAAPGRSSRPTRSSPRPSPPTRIGTALPNGESLEHLEARVHAAVHRHPGAVRRRRHRRVLRQRREPGPTPARPTATSRRTRPAP